MPTFNNKAALKRPNKAKIKTYKLFCYSPSTRKLQFYKKYCKHYKIPLSLKQCTYVCKECKKVMYDILDLLKDNVQNWRLQVLLEIEMLPKLVFKFGKQLNEILTTIISDGSKTMHSQPRLKLPAERLPKLKKKNT